MGVKYPNGRVWEGKGVGCELKAMHGHPPGRISECKDSKLEPGLPHQPEGMFAKEGGQNIFDLTVC